MSSSFQDLMFWLQVPTQPGTYTMAAVAGWRAYSQVKSVLYQPNLSDVRALVWSKADLCKLAIKTLILERADDRIRREPKIFAKYPHSLRNSSKYDWIQIFLQKLLKLAEFNSNLVTTLASPIFLLATPWILLKPRRGWEGKKGVVKWGQRDISCRAPVVQIRYCILFYPATCMQSYEKHNAKEKMNHGASWCSV